MNTVTVTPRSTPAAPGTPCAKWDADFSVMVYGETGELLTRTTEHSEPEARRTAQDLADYYHGAVNQ